MNYKIVATLVAEGKRFVSVRQIPTFWVHDCLNNGDAATNALAIIVSSGGKLRQVTMGVESEDGAIWNHEFGLDDLAKIHNRLKVA